MSGVPERNEAVPFNDDRTLQHLGRAGQIAVNLTPAIMWVVR